MAFRITEQAIEDLRKAGDYLLDNASYAVAKSFIQATRGVFEILEESPNIGSPRYSLALGIPGLRHFIMRRYDYIVVFRTLAGDTEILRVLHARQDIPSQLRQ